MEEMPSAEPTAPFTHRRVVYIMQASLSAACLVAAFVIVSPSELAAVWSRGRHGWLLLVLALMPLAVFVRAWRWWYLIGQANIALPLRAVGKITFIGQAYNLILPASLGDVVRSYHAWLERGAKEVMLASAIVDKLIAFISLCVLGIASAIVIGSIALALAATALLLPLALLLFRPSLIPWSWASFVFEKIFHRPLHVEKLIQTCRLGRRTFLVTVLISFFGWAVTNLMYFLAWRAFSPNVTIWHAFAFAPLINLMRVLPITISGLGSADLLIVFLGYSVGMQESDALLGSLAINVSLIMLPGIVGALLLLSRKALSRKTQIA